MISIKNLKKSFDSLIFEGVNLEINKGDAVVILGGSGCGKSTLLRCINRLENPDSGEIYFDGVNILDKGVNLERLRSRIGMVYQNFNLFSHLNVLENVILPPMKVKKMSRAAAVAKAKELLKMVGLENRMFYMPSQLSGGQKQRVAIARCLAMDPEVILFDEPTSALDPTMVDEVESVIKRLIDKGMTSVIVTHEMRFAKNVGTKIVFLAENGVYETGSAKDFFEHPKGEATRRFLYRSRLFEREVDLAATDFMQLTSELKAFLSEYGLSRVQAMVVEHSMEEIVVPLAHREGVSLTVRAVGDDLTEHHQLLIDVAGMEENPLESEAVDSIGVTIVSRRSRGMSAAKKEAGNWEICVEL